MKRNLLLCLFLITILSIINVSAFAETDKIIEATELADELKELGLFKGTENGYELEREATRTEAVVMLLRLMLLEEEALNSNYSHPFNDVPKWADKQIAYAYHKGLTTGISKNQFGANDKVNSAQYITFVLRATGRTEDVVLYTWDNPYMVAYRRGLTAKDEYNFNSKFTRADVVLISYKALSLKHTQTNKTILEMLRPDPIDEFNFGENWVNTAGNEELTYEINNVVGKHWLYPGIFRAEGKNETYFIERSELSNLSSWDYRYEQIFNLNARSWNEYYIGYFGIGSRYLGQSNIVSGEKNGTIDITEEEKFKLSINFWRTERLGTKQKESQVKIINSYLEYFDYFIGSKKDAYALWSTIDNYYVDKRCKEEPDFNFFGVEVIEKNDNIYTLKLNNKIFKLELDYTKVILFL